MLLGIVETFDEETWIQKLQQQCHFHNSARVLHNGNRPDITAVSQRQEENDACWNHRKPRSYLAGEFWGGTVSAMNLQRSRNWHVGNCRNWNSCIWIWVLLWETLAFCRKGSFGSCLLGYTILNGICANRIWIPSQHCHLPPNPSGNATMAGKSPGYNSMISSKPCLRTVMAYPRPLYLRHPIPKSRRRRHHGCRTGMWGRQQLGERFAERRLGDVNGTNGTYIDQHGMANGICPKIAILRQNMSVNITGFWSAPIFGESIFWSKKDPKNGEARYNPAASDNTLSLAQFSMASIYSIYSSIWNHYTIGYCNSSIHQILPLLPKQFQQFCWFWHCLLFIEAWTVINSFFLSRLSLELADPPHYETGWAAWNLQEPLELLVKNRNGFEFLKDTHFQKFPPLQSCSWTPN